MFRVECLEIGKKGSGIRVERVERLGIREWGKVFRENRLGVGFKGVACKIRIPHFFEIQGVLPVRFAAPKIGTPKKTSGLTCVC